MMSTQHSSSAMLANICLQTANATNGTPDTLRAEPRDVAGGWIQFSPTCNVWRAVTTHGRVSHHATVACAVEALALCAGRAQ